MRYGQKRALSLLIIILIIPVFALISPFKISQKLRSSFGFIVVPTMKVFHSFYQSVDSTVFSLRQLSTIKKREASQREELERLTWEVFRLREISAEYERLRKVLGYKKINEQVMVPSRVIGRDPNLWNQVLIIDKGGNSGIKLSMPVVTSLGAIGKIANLTEETSEVLLLTDIRSRVSALVKRTRDVGILRGDNTGGFILENLPRNADIQSGDLIISSGLGSIFPKGLRLGKVVKVKVGSSTLTKMAHVEPSVQFNRCEDVLVILSHIPEMVEKMMSESGK